MITTRRQAGKTLSAMALALATLGHAGFASAQDTIKVGVLHSLSGTMAISETVLKDTVLMAIDEINAKGGVLGKKLEPVVVDPASNWPLFAEKAKQLISQDKVAVTFGCWTSVSRKSVLPVFEETNALLFYPVQYEGEELSSGEWQKVALARAFVRDAQILVCDEPISALDVSKFIDIDPATGKKIEIDCTAFGRGSYSIPSRVEGLEFRTKAKFILAVETAALFERLNGHAYWRDAKCIIVAMGGVPTRANRRFVRLLSDSCKLPVYVFTDGDPYGYGNIYRTMKVGSGNAAHINEFFCVPQAKLIGVTPQDIVDYNLPTHPLEEKDKKRAQDAIKNDPFFKNNKQWVQALQEMVKMGVRVEQQAFAARLSEEFGWRPQILLETGIESTYRWFLENRSNLRD